MAGHGHDDDDDDDSGLYLTLLCWIGLGLATLDAFLQPLPAGLTISALVLAYLTGGIPAARGAVSALVQDHRCLLYTSPSPRD